MKNLKLKKIISNITIAVFSLSLMACGSSNEKNKSTLNKIKNNKKIVLGTCADYPPYEFHKQINGKDTVVGFEIDIAKEVAKDLNVDLEIKDLKFDALLPSLNAGNIDFIIAGMTPTKERRENIDFSDVYYNADQSIIVKSQDKDKFNNINDLKNLNIGVQKGSLQEVIAKKQIPNAKLKSLPKVTDLVLALNTGKVQAIIMEEPVAKIYANQDKSLAVSKIKLQDKNSGTAIAVKKGSPDFVKSLNTTIKRLKKDNKIQEFIGNSLKLQK